MSSVIHPATLDDLYRVEGKAELVGGRIRTIMPTGFRPGQIGLRIARSLDDHAVKTKQGVALPDNVGFVVPELSSGRQSFSPDAAYFFGPFKDDEFVDGAPAFAAEVRSPEDFGPAAEAELAAKRADYFAAGTQVVWDVDPFREKVVRVYRAGQQDKPAIYCAGETAEAEPALPGWQLAVAELFR